MRSIVNINVRLMPRTGMTPRSYSVVEPWCRPSRQQLRARYHSCAVLSYKPYRAAYYRLAGQRCSPKQVHSTKINLALATNRVWRKCRPSGEVDLVQLGARKLLRGGDSAHRSEVSVAASTLRCSVPHSCCYARSRVEWLPRDPCLPSISARQKGRGHVHVCCATCYVVCPAKQSTRAHSRLQLTQTSP